MLTMLGLVLTAAIVTGQAATASAAEYSYAVKFVCGTFLDDEALEPVVPGVYMTAISIGNPNDPDVDFSYDVAFTFGSVPFSRTEETIQERDATAIPCSKISPMARFSKGSCTLSPSGASTSGRSTPGASSAPATRSASMPCRS
jgi:hypothetical protein